MASRKKSPSRRSAAKPRPKSSAAIKAVKRGAVRGSKAPKRETRTTAQPINLQSVTARSRNGEPAVTEDSGLSKKELELFEQLLLQKRAQLLGDVTTLHNDALGKNRQDAAGDLSSMPIHMADLGTDNYEQEFTLGLLEGERAVLREIDEALERIRSKTYGLCLATGKAIGKARLKATPWAKYSYEYTLAQERGRARRI